MKLAILGLLISSTLSGCVLTDWDDNDLSLHGEPIKSEVNATDMQPYQASVYFQKHYMQDTPLSDNRLNTNLSNKNHNINHYVRGMMQDLVANMQNVSNTSPLVVASFVFLDSDLSHAGALGNQISESFMHEIHKFGIPVIDFKTTDYLRITETGDFVLSRDYLELKTNMAAEYVLLGTLTEQQGGILVNARIVGFNSKVVVASAQGFLPSEITNSLLNKNHNGGIKLLGE